MISLPSDEMIQLLVYLIDLVCMLLVESGLYLESNYNTNSLTTEEALNSV